MCNFAVKVHSAPGVCLSHFWSDRRCVYKWHMSSHFQHKTSTIVWKCCTRIHSTLYGAWPPIFYGTPGKRCSWLTFSSPSRLNTPLSHGKVILLILLRSDACISPVLRQTPSEIIHSLVEHKYRVVNILPIFSCTYESISIHIQIALLKNIKLLL